MFECCWDWPVAHPFFWSQPQKSTLNQDVVMYSRMLLKIEVRPASSNVNWSRVQGPSFALEAHCNPPYWTSTHPLRLGGCTLNQTRRLAVREGHTKHICHFQNSSSSSSSSSFPAFQPEPKCPGLKIPHHQKVAELQNFQPLPRVDQYVKPSATDLIGARFSTENNRGKPRHLRGWVWDAIDKTITSKNHLRFNPGWPALTNERHMAWFRDIHMKRIRQSLNLSAYVW